MKIKFSKKLTVLQPINLIGRRPKPYTRRLMQ